MEVDDGFSFSTEVIALEPEDTVLASALKEKTGLARTANANAAGITLFL
ncbi:hypothetical protein [Bacillus cereus group sp. BfR-BA-01380]|nr:hypothetical protein [Bacillus cereus group sp. BfR-BA-01380]